MPWCGCGLVASKAWESWTHSLLPSWVPPSPDVLSSLSGMLLLVFLPQTKVLFWYLSIYTIGVNSAFFKFPIQPPTLSEFEWICTPVHRGCAPSLCTKTLKGSVPAFEGHVGHRVWGVPPATTCLLPYPTPPQRLKSWKNDQADGRVRPPSIPIFTSSQILDAQSPSSYISFFQFYEACIHYHIYLFDYIWGIWFQPWQRKTKFSLSLPDVIEESFVND